MEIKELISNAPEQVSAYFVEKNYKKGSHILLPEDQNTSLFFMLSGTAEVYQYAMNGMLISIYRYEKNGCFGEVELFCKSRTALGVLAVEDCQIIKINEIGVQLWLQSDQRFCEFLLQRMAQKIGDNCDAYLRLSTMTLKERILFCVLHHERMNMLNKLTKESLATEVCAPIRSVNRILAQCKKEGLLTYEKHHFHIIDLERLEEIVGSLL